MSEGDQTVAIEALEREFTFSAGEAIHIESSYKYSMREIDTLSETAGFEREHTWFDPDRRFSVNVLRTPLDR